MTRTRKRRVDSTFERWSDSQKIEAVTLYLATGSPTQTCATLGIPISTFQKWQVQSWFKEYKTQIRDEEHLELDAKMSKIVHKALALVEDRLDNGNAQLNQKTGKLTQVPVNIKDAIKASSDLLDRRELLRDKPEQKVLEETIDNRLLKLAEQFANFSKGLKNESKTSQIAQGSIIEGEVIERTTQPI